MISQLKPLLSTRALTLTLANVGEDRIRVNVFPMKLNKEESSALSQPLSVEGTAEELDADLPAALVDYVATHLTIKQSLERTKAEMEAAEKAAREETNAKKATISGKKTTETKVEAKPQEASKPEPPKAPSLFDAEPVTPVPAPVAVPAPGASPTSEQDLEEEEILAEVHAEDDADEKEAAFSGRALAGE